MKRPKTWKLYEIVRIRTQKQSGKDYNLNPTGDANKILMQMQEAYEAKGE